MLGFPIRKSSDHSLVIDSPRLIADSYVLLRFLVPRHPPCALKNLSHKDARVHCVVLKLRAAPRPDPRLPGRTAREFEGVEAQRKSITRSLRTQQCAWRAPPFGARGSTPRRTVAVLTSSSRRGRPNNRRSTSEQCLRVNDRHHEQAPWTAELPDDAP